MRASNSVVSCHKVLYVVNKSLWTNVMHVTMILAEKSRCNLVAPKSQKPPPRGGQKRGLFGVPPGGGQKGHSVFSTRPRFGTSPPKYLLFSMPPPPRGGVFATPPNRGPPRFCTLGGSGFGLRQPCGGSFATTWLRNVATHWRNVQVVNKFT